MTQAERSWAFDDAELDSLLESMPGEGETDEMQAEPFKVVEPERLMRRYRALALEIVDIKEQHDRDAERLKAWRDRRVESRERQMQFLEYGLVAEARAQAEATKGKRKKLDTPYGYVQLRKPVPSVQVDDEGTAVAWLKENGLGLYVALKESVKKGDLRKSFEAGEVEEVPGVVLLVPTQDTATVHPYLEQGDAPN